MRTLKMLLIVCFLAVSVNSFGQAEAFGTMNPSDNRGKFAEPAGADLDKFPIMPKPLSVYMQAALGLSAKSLEKPTVVQNHFRKLRDKNGRFVLETLPVGTLVLVDKDGTLRYKADCGNRIVELVECPKCPPAITDNSATTPIKTPPTNKSGKTGFWQGLNSAIKSAATGLWNFIGGLLAPLGWLLLFLLGLALLALLAYLLYRLIRGIVDAIQNRGQGDQGQNPPPPAPPVTPGPVNPNPFVPEPAPNPVPPVQPPVVTGPTPAPEPAPPVQEFPNLRTIIDLGGGNNAARIQAGRGIARVEYERHPTNGSVSVRIFEN